MKMGKNIPHRGDSKGGLRAGPGSARSKARVAGADRAERLAVRWRGGATRLHKALKLREVLQTSLHV